jgi:hypothetical protein
MGHGAIVGVGQAPHNACTAQGWALLHFCDGHDASPLHQVRGPGSLALASLPAHGSPLSGGAGAARRVAPAEPGGSHDLPTRAPMIAAAPEAGG